MSTLAINILNAGINAVSSFNVYGGTTQAGLGFKFFGSSIQTPLGQYGSLSISSVSTYTTMYLGTFDQYAPGRGASLGFGANNTNGLQTLQGRITGTPTTYTPAGGDQGTLNFDVNASGQMYNVMTMWAIGGQPTGRVGINCNSPSYNLDVNGTMRVSSIALFPSTVGINCNSPAYPLDVGGGARIAGYGLAVKSTYGDILNTATSYGIGLPNYNVGGQASPPVAIQGYNGVVLQGGPGAGWSSAVPTLIAVNGLIGINCNTPAYQLDVNGVASISSIIAGPANQSYTLLNANPPPLGRFASLTPYSYSTAGSNTHIEIGSSYTGAGNYGNTVRWGIMTSNSGNNNGASLLINNMTISGVNGYNGSLNISTAVTIATNNNVGIGTTPSFPLDVFGVARSAIPISSLTGTSATFLNSNYGIYYYITNSAFATINLVGGTPSPAAGWYVTLRNNTGSYLSCTITGAVSSTPASPVTIPPSNSVTIAYDNATSLYVLF